MDYALIIFALILLFFIYIVTRVMRKPFKWLVKLTVNCTIALVSILAINFMGKFIGFHLPINPISVLGVGVLGIPGMILLIVMNFLMI